MCALNTKESTRKIIEAMGIHYKFCKEHSTLGMTPSEAAGIKLNLQGNKVEALIRLSINKL